MDFKFLKQKIENATKKAFIEMFEKHGAEKICAFALYSDEDAMTVCPSTNTLKHLETADKDEYVESKFCTAEWKYEMKGAPDKFAEISTLLREEYNKHEDNDKWFEEFQKQLFETCIAVLEKLKNEDFFKKIVGEDIFLNFTVSDYDYEIKDKGKTIIRLNDNVYKTEYLDWMKTWSQ